jgi:hypothetical protein
VSGGATDDPAEDSAFMNTNTTPPYSKSRAEFILLRRDEVWDALERRVPMLGFFGRLKHVVLLLFERASRCYEFFLLAFDACDQCFEQRDALGSSDEYSEVV